MTKLVKILIPKMAKRQIKCECQNALRFAVQSDSKMVKSAASYKNVSLFLDKYFK